MTNSQTDNDNIKQLRLALAINRGMEYLKRVPTEHASDKTIEHDIDGRFNHLEALLPDIHRTLFADTWKQDDIGKMPGHIEDSEERKALRTALLDTLCYPNNGYKVTNGSHPKPLFDSNGSVIYHEPGELAGILGDFYSKMHDVKLFAYGNKLALNLFMTTLGKLPAFRANYPDGIDFRRLDEEDCKVLREPQSSALPFKRVFEHALDGKRTPHLRNQPADGEHVFPSHVEYVDGLRFLSHEKDGTKCLVTVNGGLVPFTGELKAKLKQQINSPLHVAQFDSIPDDQLVGHIGDEKELRDPSIKVIDGIPLPDHAAPLLCIDVNILSGLTNVSHKALEALIKNVEANNKDASIFDLADNHGLKEALLSRVTGDKRMTDAIEIAYQHLTAVTEQLDEWVGKGDKLGKLFDGKSAVTQGRPIFVESFGGAGSGKSAAKGMMEKKYGNNFVEASLDSFREHSKLYKVLIAANHHGDDYRLTEKFANTMRDWVAKKALAKNFNILYDGTGIPYKPRYSDLTKSFKAKGFDTEVMAFDVPLGVALQRVKKRFDEVHRALPWNVAIGKHIVAPQAFMHAVEDPNVDKLSFFATEGEKDKPYLIAETFNNTEPTPRNTQSTVNYVRDRAKNHEQSMMRQLAGAEGVDDFLTRNHEFKEGNVYDLAYPGNRILSIYNVRRFNQFMEKGNFNPSATYSAKDKKGFF